ncbi:pentapeptide repeat-containing protein [Mangrovicoccus sp. HB161399]|uniref:pentapeptide repeat-containing protein n=1 Tax=Mangrovicoccus sp. HB161399 TaxID=2720392 RepID=UPI0015542323|nr:pentapeptide repeat-containing protein [Mangrovicoccus sp. HB161399]
MSRDLNLRRTRHRPGPPAPEERSAEQRIARINELTQAGRTNWFSLLAYLTFMMITVLGVEDADFFIPSRQTQLPLVGVSIPTASFFAFAPILAAALHVYLHLFLRKCSEELAHAPARYKGDPLERAIHPWLVNDLILRARRRYGEETIARRPMDWLSGVTAMLLVWWAAPLILIYTWIRSLPAHDEAMSALIAVCTFFVIYASLSSWVKMWGDLRHPWLLDQAATSGVFVVSALLLSAHLVLTVLTTEGGMDRLTGQSKFTFARAADKLETTVVSDNRPDWSKSPWIEKALATFDPHITASWLRSDRWLVAANLAGVQFSALPPEAADLSAARHRFREEWCKRHGLSPDVCGRSRGSKVAQIPSQWTDRNTWCEAHGIKRNRSCETWFADLDDAFDAEWSDLRRRITDALDKPNLGSMDLRGADLRSAALVGVNLSNAQMEGAILYRASLENADLAEARLQGAIFSLARMPGADLRGAYLEGARLDFAELDGAILRDARMQGARLQSAQMKGSDIRQASMPWTNLYSADMEGADLRDTEMRGAILRRARLDGARLEDAKLQGAVLKGAYLQGAALRHTHLQGAVMEGAFLEGAVLTGAYLQGAVLSGAHLKEAVLDSAHLQGAVLEGVRMQEADLSEANIQNAKLREAELERADLSRSLLTGTGETSSSLHSANLKSSVNQGGAARFADLSRAAFNDRTDWRNAFIDGSVDLPSGFPIPIVRACGWITQAIEDDLEFYGKWRGWHEAGPLSRIWWDLFAPDAWRDAPAIPPPPGCDWDTSPLSGAAK